MWRVLSALNCRPLAWKGTYLSVRSAKDSLCTCRKNLCTSFCRIYGSSMPSCRPCCVYTGLQPTGIGAVNPLLWDTLRFGERFRQHTVDTVAYGQIRSSFTSPAFRARRHAVQGQCGCGPGFGGCPKKGHGTPETVPASAEQAKTKQRHRWPANLKLRDRWGIVNRYQQRRLSLGNFLSNKPNKKGAWIMQLGDIVRGVIQRVRKYKEGFSACRHELSTSRWSQGQSRIKQHLASQRRLLQRHRQSIQLKRQQLEFRVRQSLLEHQRRVLQQLRRGGTELQKQRIAWAERRTQKLAEAMAMLNAQTQNLQKATASAKERLRQLWKLYGWTALVSYTIVHVSTLLALFGVVSAVPPQKLAGIAQTVRVGEFVDKGAGTWWSCWLIAYFAAKVLTPVQVALAIWLTPGLSRLMGHKIGAMGGKAAAAAARGARRTLRAAGMRRL